MADTGDTYIERLCDALADVLTRAANGTKDRLAGYVANFDFWVGEADHCLLLIKEYDERFRRFQEAQHRVASGAPLNWNERSGWSPPPMDVKRSASWNERNRRGAKSLARWPSSSTGARKRV